jgi:hypothetical protein
VPPFSLIHFSASPRAVKVLPVPGAPVRISGLELYNQLRYNSVHPEITGEALFALRHLREKRFTDSLKKCWPTSVPAMK